MEPAGLVLANKVAVGRQTDVMMSICP